MYLKLINDFNDALTDSEKDLQLKSIVPALAKFIYTRKKYIPDEYLEDIQQDLILLALEAQRDFDEERDTKFITYLYHRMKKTFETLITRTTGVQISWRDFARAKAEGVPVKVSLINYNDDYVGR